MGWEHAWTSRHRVEALLRTSEVSYMGVISGASILHLWQPAPVGIAAKGAAATQQTSLPASQPPQLLPGLPQEGLAEDLLPAECGGGKQWREQHALTCLNYEITLKSYTNPSTALGSS